MKIYIDRCHGCGQDRGASGFLNEETMSDKMIDLVIPKLKSLGHTVLAQRPSGNLTVGQSINWRCQQANAWGADIFVSVHNNSATSSSARGSEVFTYNGNRISEAQRYLEYILNHGGLIHASDVKSINQGIKNGNEIAGVLTGTTMGAMLVENFFVSNSDDCDFFSNNIEMFANSLVYGITGVDLGKVEIDEMAYEGKQEVDNKITVYAHSTVPNVHYKYYYELNGRWTTVTDWQESNRCSFVPRTQGKYKVVCHIKFKNSTTDKEDAYNFIIIDIADKPNIYNMNVDGRYYGETHFEDIAKAVEKEMKNGLKEITLIKK